jgi:hypothetical protein
MPPPVCLPYPSRNADKTQHYLALAIDQGRSMWWSYCTSTRGQDLNGLQKHSSKLAEVLERVGRALAEEWGRLGCVSANSPTISKLRKASNGGTVVIANISSYRWDALILQRDEDVTLVILSQLSRVESKGRKFGPMRWIPLILKIPTYD